MLCSCSNFTCSQKRISAVFAGLWESLECYWPNASLCRLRSSTVAAYLHTVEFNIRLYILNCGIGCLVHSILILQLQWHFGEQLYSDLQLPTAAEMQISWSKSEHRPIFYDCVVPTWWTLVHSSAAGAQGWQARIQIIFLLFSKTTPPRVARCLQRLAFQARPVCLTRQSRSAARSAHVGDRFHGEYQM